MGRRNLEQILSGLAREGELYERVPGGRLRCYACGHRCLILPGQRGVCKVRWNQDGRLMVPKGYVAALQLDPVEKKPFFHALPGSRALSFGMLGCDLHCGYCQNALTSQALRDPAMGVPPEEVTAEDLVTLALRRGARILTSTYNEPLISSEWAVEVFKTGRQRGLVPSYVSNGNATPEVLEYLRPWVDLYKVDLKGFDDRHYRWTCPGLVEGELLRCALLAHALPRLVGAMAGPFWGDREIAPPWPIVAPGGNAAADFSRDVVRTAPAA